jgi:ribonuclease HI
LDKMKPSWKRMRFKKNKVWLSVDQNGDPIVKDDKVLIKYQLEQDYEYWVNPKRVTPIEPLPATKNDQHRTASTIKAVKPETKIKTQSEGYQEAINSNAICIFTDGASSGNPGPSGVGIVLRFGTHQKEITKPIGVATNNIAELEAIKTGLLELKKTDLPVRIFTDSKYAYGVLVLGWKAKKNQRLIESIKKLIETFKDIKFIKIKGHYGIAENERADFLATSASQIASSQKV